MDLVTLDFQVLPGQCCPGHLQNTAYWVGITCQELSSYTTQISFHRQKDTSRRLSVTLMSTRMWQWTMTFTILLGILRRSSTRYRLEWETIESLPWVMLHLQGNSRKMIRFLIRLTESFSGVAKGNSVMVGGAPTGRTPVVLVQKYRRT